MRFSRRVSPAQVKQLFRAAGWTGDLAHYSDRKLRRTLDHSHLIVTAWSAKDLVGFANAISDGVVCAMVENLVVHPKHRSRGLGTRMLRSLRRELRRHRVEFVFTLGPRGRRTREFFGRAGFQPLAWGVFLCTR